MAAAPTPSTKLACVSTERITASDDPRLADYVDLRGGRPDGVGPVVVEGLFAVEQLLNSRCTVRNIVVTPGKLGRLPDPGDAPVYVADPDVLRATVGFDLHRGVVASADRPAPLDPAALLAGSRRVVVAERLNDLENLGSLFRAARAFACDAVLLDPETADPLGRRPVRVSMGHVLHVPFARLAPWPDALALVRDAGLEVVALAPSGGPLLLPGRAALLVGAEGPGLSAGALAASDRSVRIDMAAGVDSLNVATAAAVALHAHRSGRFVEPPPTASAP
jgi:tRNA G18 (ribose-2'-O)-methylase SpoU